MDVTQAKRQLELRGKTFIPKSPPKVKPPFAKLDNECGEGSLEKTFHTILVFQNHLPDLSSSYR